jgi:4-hydroxybenzoate polyprenyltransferase
VHPFPSILDGLATAALASLAGAPASAAGRLGIAMVSLQAAIGALNDLVDAPRDAGLKPGKPIPAGLVSQRTARVVVLVGTVLGLGLSVASGPETTAAALLVLAVGGIYDLRFKGTPWSWLPFAVGIPLLPVYAWFGAAGKLPVAFAILVPAAAIAGAALAIANALADVERDLAAGTVTVVTRLSPRRAWSVHAVLQASVVALAVIGLAWLGSIGRGLLPVVGAAAVVAVGVALSAGGTASRRERAWEIEAVGIALLGAGWVGVVGLAPV